MNETDTTERRLVDLESRSAFQEETVRELNDALVRQQERIDRLEASLNVVVEQLRQGGGQDEGQTNAPENERPPHY